MDPTATGLNIQDGQLGHGVTRFISTSDDGLRITIYVTQGLCLVLVTIFVALRLYMKFSLLNSLEKMDCK
jgi:hypothetical protein